jgi:hypothetical protein
MMNICDGAQHPSDEGDDKESLAGVSPQTTTNNNNNALMSRLQAFLPQIKEANQGKCAHV